MGGKFTGGVDICIDLIESGEFDEMVPADCKKLSEVDEFKQLLSNQTVVALINGTLEQ